MQVELNDELDFVCPYTSSQDSEDDMEYYLIYEVRGCFLYIASVSTNTRFTRQRAACPMETR
jgi:hypothetical protein